MSCFFLCFALALVASLVIAYVWMHVSLHMAYYCACFVFLGVALMLSFTSAKGHLINLGSFTSYLEIGQKDENANEMLVYMLFNCY